ncbi:MAG: hypothetical protein J0M17_06945 [Planctomycetes bacterium]|nr:hypothetical protein [Planctomycetota bacterium]
MSRALLPPLITRSRKMAEQHDPFFTVHKAFELETKRIETLANAQLTLMNAAKVGEEIHGLAITNAGRELALQRARNQLRRLDAQRNEREREARRLTQAGLNLAFYRKDLTGKNLGAVRQNVWAGFEALLQVVPSSVEATWFGTPIDRDKALAPSCWLWKSAGDQPTTPAFPAEMDDVFDLLAFQSKNRGSVVVVFNSFAWRATNDALQLIIDAKQQEVDNLEEEIAKIVSGDPEALKLAQLLGSAPAKPTT